MNTETIARLAAINARFYEASARAFSRTREAPWPGWARLFALVLPTIRSPLSVIDAGAGNGRFLLALRAAIADAPVQLEYLGVDTSDALLADARARLEALTTDGRTTVSLVPGDVTAAGVIAPFAPASLVVAMGLLHHVAGRDHRLALVRALAEKTAPGGWLAVTVWLFGERARFASKVLPWSVCPEIDPAELEPGDVLLGFGDEGPRYCHALGPDEEGELVRAAMDAGLTLSERYEADGAGGDLNRYLVFRRPA